MKVFFHIFCALLIGLTEMPLYPHTAYCDDEDQVDILMEGFAEEDVDDTVNRKLDDIMSGFDEDGAEDLEPAGSDRKPSAITIDGYLKFGTAWNTSHEAPGAGETDWRGLSKLRPEAQVDTLIKWHPDWRLLVSGKAFYDAAYALRGRDEFTDEVIDTYEWEAEWRELYLRGRLGPHLDIKAGRQIVVWGRSDNIRVTDVLNPLDVREPGLTDIEDLRLPIAMARLDGYYGPWSLTGISVHEIRFDKIPVYGSDFYPGPARLPPEEVPSDGGDNTEWALALNGIFSGKDISLYWAELFDDTAHVDVDAGGMPVRKHARVTMWGAAGNLVLGNWILKSEAAHWSGIRFFNANGRTYRRLDFLIGTEYSGWDDTTVTVEWAVRHLYDFDERLESPPDHAQEDDITNAVRLSRNFMNDTVEVTLLALVYGPLGQDGTLGRLSVEYDWSDTISLLFGAVVYQAGDKQRFKHLGDNDRVFAEIKYSF